ncbi:hypothetical protein EYF80_032439 [Liparis tanakae]|uniref:Uncharacterized protein n=1 Tax=Liparis tanakae TaxID=230148 RepID=A0A4Z2GX68_9TELE|nr:hypothetical protein EYF80_032439 [Liparis tanakae]
METSAVSQMKWQSTAPIFLPLDMLQLPLSSLSVAVTPTWVTTGSYGEEPELQTDACDGEADWDESVSGMLSSR